MPLCGVRGTHMFCANAISKWCQPLKETPTKRTKLGKLKFHGIEKQMVRNTRKTYDCTFAILSMYLNHIAIQLSCVNLKMYKMYGVTN